MNEPDRLSESALRQLDDLQLEAVRLDLLRSDDERYELVVEHLLLRGIATIERVASQLCELRGASAEQLSDAVVDASLRLQLRLLRPVPLPSIDTLAAQLAGECVRALQIVPAERPRLAARPPRLRAMETQLGDALRSGRLKPKGGQDS
jgi:hypothetical protein